MIQAVPTKSNSANFTLETVQVNSSSFPTRFKREEMQATARRKKVNKGKWLIRANHPKEAERELFQKSQALRTYQFLQWMNWKKNDRGSRRLPNHQSSSSVSILSRPVSYRAAFSLTLASFTLGEKSCKSSLLPARPSSLSPQAPRPLRLQRGPTPCRPPVPPASGQGKMGGGAGGSQTPSPAAHHSLVQPGFARSERLHRLCLGRGWGCSSAPGSCHRWSGD